MNRPTTNKGRLERAAARAARLKEMEDSLVSIAAKFGITLDAMRSRSRIPKIKGARAEFIRAAHKLAGYGAIADILHCDETTVRYHAKDGFRERKRATNDRYVARCRAAAGENRGTG